MSNTFVTFAIGERRVVHCQVNFAILSLFAHSFPEPPGAVCIVTDRPEYYRWLKEKVSVIAVDQAVIDEWRGPHRYFWRLKLRVMQSASERAPGNLVYLDADVICTARLAEFLALLDAGKPLMYLPEYEVGSKGGSGKSLWKQAGGRRFGRFAVESHSRMWNAGLVALPAAISNPWLADALECLDDMCRAGIDSAFMEQFSLSLSLDRERTCLPAVQWFHHYWGHKLPWNALIARYLADINMQQLPFDEACERFRDLRLETLMAANPRTRIERVVRSIKKRVSPREERIDRMIAGELTK